MKFSFLLPTRGRPDLVKRFLDSVVQTAHDLAEIEVVLCIDEDDPASRGIARDDVAVRTVVVPPGLAMGALNRACFDASTGRYVMLINDDVVLRTAGWDREVHAAFASLGDDVGLIHTNDLLFREKLCTFPILSRAACAEIGVCPAEYRRYRIDDHVYDTYNLLAHLGHPRILWLPDVVFEHLNYHQRTPDGGDGHLTFRSEDDKVYRPNAAILEEDAAIFDAKLEERKADALRLAGLIDRAAAERTAAKRGRLLARVTDRFGYRRPEFVRTRPAGAAPKPSATATVTVGVVTADIYKPYARECLSLLKKHTPRLDLVILDNGGSKDFKHTREMNKLLRLARTDFLVLLDDDVLVEEGWLDGLLAAMDDETAVVGPVHKDRDGQVSHTGVYLAGDSWGTHAHLTDVPEAPRVAPCLCSACLLIDLKKAGHIRFDERYDKYFLDLDHSLQTWEAGYKVVCTPRSVVTHLAGATMPHGSPASIERWNRDLKVFGADWIRSGRLARLQADIFGRFPFLLLLDGIPRRIREVTSSDTWEVSGFREALEDLARVGERLPLFAGVLVGELTGCLARAKARGDELKARTCEEFLKRLEGTPVPCAGPIPVLVEAYGAYNLVRHGDGVLAVPRSLGPLNLLVRENREREGILAAPDLEAARRAVDAAGGKPAPAPAQAAAAPAPDRPVLIESYRGFNLVGLGTEVFAVPIALGPLDMRQEASRSRPGILRAASAGEARRLADAAIDGAKPAAAAPPPAPAAKAPPAPDDLAPPTVRARAYSPPVLVQEGYKEFNVVRYGGRYYGLHQADGEFDPERATRGSYSRLLSADTVDEVKSLIDRRGVPLLRRAARRVKRALMN